MRQIKIIPLHEAHAFHSFKHWNLDLTGKVLFVDLITGADPESKHQKLTLHDGDIRRLILIIETQKKSLKINYHRI